MIDKKKLLSQAAAIGVNLSDNQAEQFDLFSRLLVETNEKFNLTAIKDPDEIVTKHLVDCLTLFPAVDFPEGAGVIDIGTGAGFPAVPLLIYRPDLKITALDSTGKKLNFVESAVSELGLSINLIHGRAEEYGRGDLRESFDFAVSRAVASLNVLCEYCLPFVKAGGKFISMKGSKADEELALSRTAVRTLGGRFAECREFTLADGIERNLVIIEKASPSPPKYPRPSAQISRKPL